MNWVNNLKLVLEKVHHNGANDGFWAFMVKILTALLLSVFLVGCATQASIDGKSLAVTKTAVTDSELFELSARAEAAYQDNQLHAAARDYQYLADRVPEDAWIWFRLGNIQARQGEYDAAIRAYANSLERDSQSYKTWYNLSTAYLLNAQLALQNSLKQMPAGSGEFELVQEQLNTLEQLIFPN